MKSEINWKQTKPKKKKTKKKRKEKQDSFMITFGKGQIISFVTQSFWFNWNKKILYASNG